MNDAIGSTISMESPNQGLLVYNGELYYGDLCFQGKIFVKWVPRHQLRFEIPEFPDEGIISDKNDVLFNIGNLTKEIKFSIENKFYGDTVRLKGSISGNLFFTYSKRKVKYIDFNLTNFRDYIGETFNKSVKSKRVGHVSFLATDHKIEIQNILDDNKKNKIAEEGGYLISNNCRIVFNKVQSTKRINFIIRRLIVFLSFLNGRRTAPLFLKGYSNSNNLIWEDYSPYITDPYKYVQSWLPFRFDNEFCSLWQKFLNITETDHDFEKVEFIIHWYLEALNNSGYTNGSIIFLQNSFESLYSWLVLEKREIHINGKAKNQNTKASDNIRSLLFHFGLSSEFPKEYKKIFKGFDVSKSEDFAFVFTTVRNAYVHYGESKRRNLEKIKGKTWPLLNTALFYFEILLLKIMGYSGIMRSRVKGSGYLMQNQVSVLEPTKVYKSK